MAVRFLKKALKTPATEETETRDTVARMLRDLEQWREASARAYAKQLDKYEGDILVDRDAIARASRDVPDRLKDDIRFAYKRVRAFAEMQKASLLEFETELSPGVWAGQKLIPIDTAGCYVPGGRYAHVASAIMSIATAKVAGVPNVIACSSPKGPNGINPAILYTMDLCGADQILCLGGVQGIAALAFGLFTGKPAGIVVGPGNRFVAETKRMLFGQIGIDLFAGPTEILIIADAAADAELVAQDLVGQAEHGPDSPAWLVTTDKTLARKAMTRVPELIATLPETQRVAATAAWNDYGEVLVCDSREEAARASDAYAAEHLELQPPKTPGMLKCAQLRSLFIGEQTTVAFGDKCSGTNQRLPTKGAAHYSGGLSVHELLKVVTTQRMTKQGFREIAAVTARICGWKAWRRTRVPPTRACANISRT